MKYHLIAADLDGTLALSKEKISGSMAHMICRIIQTTPFAIISGGNYSRFMTQVVDMLPCHDTSLQNLFLLPENGSSLYVYDGEWKAVYKDTLPVELKERIRQVFALHTVPPEVLYGEQLEDRGGQMTFSALGQQAPLQIKETWDPDARKRKEIVEKIKPLLPECEITIGGMTSIDITRKGVTKAYAMKKILEHTNRTIQDVLFFGDAIFPGGNDQAVPDMGVYSIKVSGPEETYQKLQEIIFE